MTARIGMDDPAGCIDQKHSRAERIEAIRERCGLYLLKVDYFADENGTTDVRNQACHALSGVLIDDSVAVAADYLKKRATCGGFLKDGEHVIYNLLGGHPLNAESCAAHFFSRDDFDKLMNLFDIKENCTWKHWIYFCVFVDIELSETGVVAPGEISIRCFTNGVLSKKMRRTAMQKLANLLENGRPQRGIERRIVNIAN